MPASREPQGLHTGGRVARDIWTLLTLAPLPPWARPVTSWLSPSALTPSKALIHPLSHSLDTLTVIQECKRAGNKGCFLCSSRRSQTTPGSLHLPKASFPAACPVLTPHQALPPAASQANAWPLGLQMVFLASSTPTSSPAWRVSPPLTNSRGSQPRGKVHIPECGTKALNCQTQAPFPIPLPDPPQAHTPSPNGPHAHASVPLRMLFPPRARPSTLCCPSQLRCVDPLHPPWRTLPAPWSPLITEHLSLRTCLPGAVSSARRGRGPSAV